MIGRALTRYALNSAERGLLPDTVIRAGIRHLCRQRLRTEEARIGAEDPVEAIVPAIDLDVIALAVDEANEQHYEVPAAFFEIVLGRQLKYSSGYWGDGATNLDDAEAAALEATITRAEVSDGQDILELGCGWGSLTLALADRFRRSRITAVSNSSSQASFIRERLARIDRDDVKIVTQDMNSFDPGRTFDRIISVEMFEHMRSWSWLLDRVASWLDEKGQFFAHVFAHQSIPYLFEDKDEDDWMSREFFTGGLMPSVDLMPRTARSLTHQRTWTWNGENYARTANAWLARLDDRRTEVEQLLSGQSTPPSRLTERWRMFFMACAELFAFDDGNEWVVAHHLFSKPQRIASV